MSGEMALLHQLNMKVPSDIWTQFGEIKHYKRAHYNSNKVSATTGGIPLSDGTTIAYTNASSGIIKYSSSGSASWTVLPSTVGAAYDKIHNPFVDITNGVVYGVATDDASPYNAQVFKINISTGAVTLIGSAWAMSGIYNNFNTAVGAYFDGTYYYFGGNPAGTNTNTLMKINVSTGALTTILSLTAAAYYIVDATYYISLTSTAISVMNVNYGNSGLSVAYDASYSPLFAISTGYMIASSTGEMQFSTGVYPHIDRSSLLSFCQNVWANY